MLRSSDKPLVVSVCGTFLKPEMLSVYRQITGLQRWQTQVFCEERINADKFPFPSVTVMRRNKFRAAVLDQASHEKLAATE